MSLVVGTAGHIDHGKTTLLRALTGIDADRLPEEQRRGMTIDVGYAHVALEAGPVIDFVDVPGHERLVGNMLVGAGEVDAALLVVAADDGPRPQTVEHLELLDAVGIEHALAVVTKIDLVEPERATQVAEEVRDLLAATALRGTPVLRVSATTGQGLGELRAALAMLPLPEESTPEAPRLAIDRAFSVRGRGLVVTGTLRGGRLRMGGVLELVPDGRRVRVREVQVHGARVDEAGPGRTALNLAGVAAADVRRGDVLAAPGAVWASDRLLVALRPPAPLRTVRTSLPTDRSTSRLHLGTEQLEVRVGRAGREAMRLAEGRVTAILRLPRPVAAAPGDRFVLRDTARGETPAAGTVLDAQPPRGVSRRRATPERIEALAAAVASSRGVEDARLDLHGMVGGALADDVRDAVAQAVLAAVDGAPDALPLAALRGVAGRALRRSVAADPPSATDAAAAEVIEWLVRDGRLERERDRVGPPGRTQEPPDERLLAGMDALVAALDRPDPPPLLDAARAVACPADGIGRLERAGRIVVVGPNLAWSFGAWTALARTAASMAARSPLAPAALRDATGTSRKYVMPLLEDLNRRGILARTPTGHVPGPRAATLAVETSVA